MLDFADSELAKQVGQLFIVGFDGATPQAPHAVRQALAAGTIGGAILFRRNVDNVDQVAALTADLHGAAAPAPYLPFVAVDQEGGRVVRLKEPLTPLPTARALGAARDLRDVSRVSEVLATELSTLGFNLNFAPVLDVDTNPDNPVIGDRAFSDDPTHVARCGAGFMLGHHAAGVVPCGKHFPGHGDTTTDSHLELPRLDHDRARLDEVELYPFQRNIAAGIPMLMTAHIMIPALDPDHPATLSAPIIDGLLRDELGFDGVVITDCLEMKAVADRYEIEEMIDLGISAGVDLFLICHTEAKWTAAVEHLYQRASTDELVRRRVEESAARVVQLKEDLMGHWPRPWEPQPSFKESLGLDTDRALVAPYLDNTPRADPTEADSAT